MKQVERIERHGLEELRARRCDDRRVMRKRIDQRMMNVHAYPRVGVEAIFPIRGETIADRAIVC